MKLAIWSSSYFKGIGGAEKFVNDLLTCYSKKGIQELFLIANRFKKNQKENKLFTLLSANVFVYHNTFHNPLLSTKQPVVFIIKLLLYFKASIQFGFFLYRNKIQIMHLHLVNIDVLLLVLYKFLFRYKLILTFTGLELELAQTGSFSKFKLKAALKYADGVTAVSSDICRRLNKEFGFQHSHYIQNGIDLKQVKKYAANQNFEINKNHFLFCGRLMPIKRVSFLIDAFYECIKAVCHKDLYIIGDGEDEEKIKALVKNYGIQDRAIMLGALHHHQVIEVMNQCCCFILSSLSEACPMVVLEAMSLGKPVIVPDVGGLRDMVQHGENGYLYPVDRKDLLCHYMMMIARSEKQSKEMGQKGIEIITKKFDLDKIVQKYLDLYMFVTNQDYL